MFSLCVSCIALTQIGIAEGDRAHLYKMPAHAILSNEDLYGYFGANDGDANLYALRVAGPSKDKWRSYRHPTAGDGILFNFRHYIKDNCIWLSFDPYNLYRLKTDELEIYDIANPNRENQFRKKYGNFGPLGGGGHLIQIESQAFHLETLGDKYFWLTLEQFGAKVLDGRPAKDVAGFGSVPTSVDGCKSFVLSRKTKEFEIWDSTFAWDAKIARWKPKPSPRFEKIGHWIDDLDSSDFQKRTKSAEELENLGRLAEPALEKALTSRPSIELRRRVELVLEKVRSGESQAPKIGMEAYNYEKFGSLFTEDFYFFLRKNDYFFVTESGKLYWAPSPKKGEKSRPMKELWGDGKRPIVAVIEDANYDKVWLFAKDLTAEAKRGLFFEMNETIRTSTFDPAKLTPAREEGRAKMLLEFLPLISPNQKK